MKKTIRFTSLLIFVSLFLGLFSVCVFAKEEEILYVNFGDSIAWGKIENKENFPEYDAEKDSYSGLFAGYLGTDRTNYARRGMQTTDVLYMIDDQFHDDVDKGVLHPDSWHTGEYPPYDGTSLEVIKENTRKAQYITLCVGVCDYVSYPDEIKQQRQEEIGNADEARERLNELADNGKLDRETFELLFEVLKNDSDKAGITVRYIMDIVYGFIDYTEYYPRIVSTLRTMNQNGKIILIGNYLPGSKLSFLWENEESSKVVRLVNSLVDNMNLVIKEAAAKYDCYYVDTCGVETNWHPTVKGYQQICDRMISVLNGDPTYAGNVKVVSTVAQQIKTHIDTMFNRRENKRIKTITNEIEKFFYHIRVK